MIYCAIMGLGIVGGGVADVLINNRKAIAEKVGDEIEIKYILDIKDLHEHPLADRVVTDINIILNDPDVSVVAELMGGSHPAFDFSLACLKAGKNVVTSNKEVVANFGDVLLEAAEENGVRYLFEASVGGGIPIIRPMSICLAANEISEISGILNGTTNYILTRMFRAGISFSNALAEAQEKGYAEKDPTADVDGIDACRKIVILSALAYGKLFSPDDVDTEGIRTITEKDVRAAEIVGGAVRLIGRSGIRNGKVFIHVSPFIIPAEHPLYGVCDVYNAISIKGNAVGDVMFYGRGAGNLPTASAVAADIIDVAVNAESGIRNRMVKAKGEELFNADLIPYRYCIRVNGADQRIKALFPDAIADGDDMVACTKPMTKAELDASLCGIDSFRAIRILDI